MVSPTAPPPVVAEHVAMTVGEIRAELLLYPDDAPVVVVVPDHGQPSISAVLPVVGGGSGSGVAPDEVLASVLELRAGLRGGVQPGPGERYGWHSFHERLPCNRHRPSHRGGVRTASKPNPDKRREAAVIPPLRLFRSMSCRAGSGATYDRLFRKTRAALS
ncbi:hypothetical protein [Cellulomonas sp. P5_C5]